MTRLTVALCTYNRAAYLEQAIQAILNQTYRDFKLKIYDNASTDNTPEIVGKYKDARIQYLRFNQNAGMTGNWLRAIRGCDTELISIAHDDDIMEPTLLEKEIDAMDTDSYVVLTSCRITLINKNGVVISDLPYPPYDKDLLLDKLGYYRLFAETNGETYIMAPSVMMRADALKQMDLSFLESSSPVADTYLYLKLNEAGKFCLLSEPLLKYRLHGVQESGSSVNMLKEFEKRIIPLLATVLDKNSISAINEWASAELRRMLLLTPMAERFNEDYRGFYINESLKIDDKLLARIKFLNHLAKGKEKKYVIWGAGSAGLKNKQIFDALLPNYRLTGFIDSRKTGLCEGLPVFSPESCGFEGGDYIVVCVSGVFPEIADLLQEKGFKLNDDFMIGYIG